jgi:tryptophanyl-tRNA synthetase
MKREIENIEKNAVRMVIDCLGAGVSFESTNFYLQSNIMEMPYLYMLIHNLITVGRAYSSPSLKIMLENAKLIDMPMGLLAYPVMEAGDIIAMQADKVVVGKDNIDHIAITEEIVKKINSGFQAALTIPECISDGRDFVVGLDGRHKMSKSLNNAIFISDSEAEIDYKINHAPWYSYEEEGKGRVNAIMQYIHIFGQDGNTVKSFMERFIQNEEIEKAAKEYAKQTLNDLLHPIRERINVYAQDEPYIEKKIREGSQMAREITQENLKKIKEMVGFKNGLVNF